MRFSWVQPDESSEVQRALRRPEGTFDELFDERDALRLPARPPGVPATVWPSLAEHVARCERVREVFAATGADATRRFAASPHAVERAALLAARSDEADLDTVVGILACAVDEWMAYGPLLSRLVELGLPFAPERTVGVFEDFVARAVAVPSELPAWRERVRFARDGLAAVYVRTGRDEDAERLFHERFLEEPRDVTVAIGAARAFLEAGRTGRSIRWLERAAERADRIDRAPLAERLRAKVAALHKRLA